MQHLIDNLQYRVPLLIVLITLTTTEILYVMGMPIHFDLWRCFQVLLDAIIVCQLIFLLIIRNEIRRLGLMSRNLNLNNKMSIEEFEEHKKQVTKQQLDRLRNDERFKNLVLRTPSQHPCASENPKYSEDESSSSDSAPYEITSHQLATKKKLF